MTKEIESTTLALTETRHHLENLMALHQRTYWHRIYWLNGSPCAGKSTVASAVAERLGWRVYHCDDHDQAHRQRATPARHPTFHDIAQLQGDALWLRPVAEQLETEIRYHGEQFTLVLEDLLRLAAEDERPVLCEGSAGLPHLLQPILPDRHHAFWLIPTEPFQRHHYAQRPWVAGVLSGTSDPQRAFDNWMQRDAGFARWLEEQVSNYTMSWLSVDGSMTVEETVERVVYHFQHQISDVENVI